METLAFKLIFNGIPARLATWNGRQYLVAPLTMIVPGVLAGSDGPGYYPPDETQRAVPSWEGVPLTVNHPYDPQTGESLFADEGDVLDRQGIGVVRKPLWNGKLRAKGWFDVEHTQQKAPSVYQDLLAGRPIELSTGLRVRHDRTPGTHNGRPYSWIARDHQPDHLAVLVGQKGACSLDDGCGVHVNNSDPQCPT